MPEGIRPTRNMVRKAIFDILGNIKDLSLLELFAGSGAVGLEAVSRGAKEVVFVENNPQVLKVLTQNLSYILYIAHVPRIILEGCLRGRQAKCCTLPMDAQAAVKRLAQDGRKFDIIFLDPPYYQELLKKTLQTLGAYDILSPAGLIVAQHSKKEILSERLGVLSLLKQSVYGDTLLSFYKKG